MDPGVAKLLERTRARRGELKEFSSDRSPLPSEKTRDRSPLKQVNRTVETSPYKSPLKSKSPRKAEAQGEDSPSNTIKRILSRESLENNVKELISRDSPGKTIVTKTIVSPSKTTYTKTVITEKEEKYEKKEIISYSGNKKALDNLKEKFDNLDKADTVDEKTTNYDSGTFTKKPSSSPTRTIPILKEKPMETVSSPTKKASPAKSYSPSKSKPSYSSPLKSASKIQGKSDDKPTENLGDWESGRKARLANLANKFKNYDDDEDQFAQKQEIQLPKPVTKPLPRVPSPSKHAPVSLDHLRSRSPVKASSGHSNPNQFISPQTTARALSPDKANTRPLSPTKPSDNVRNSPARTRSVRFVSPTKAPAPQTPEPRAVSPCVEARESTESSLMESLKAQGFQESGSKSKLVYKFDHNKEETPARSPVKSNNFVQDNDTVVLTLRNGVVKERERSVSPMRANPFLVKDKQDRGRSPTKKPAPAPPRSYSPEKPHPLQFVSPAHQSPSKSPVRQERGRSPTKKPVAPQPRSYSPEKPHPLQFVAPGVGQGPPKPNRTFEAKNNLVKTVQQQDEERVDSPARMSLSAKREMFESGAHLTPEAEKPDPAMMSLSQRKALFEKVKSVPTPIARFGESVTPAMLAKQKPSDTPTATPSEAWKRKRPVSPAKDMIMSAAKHEAARNQPTPKVVTQPSVTPKVPMPRGDDDGTPQIGRKTGEMHKKLFEANNSDWRDNDIAKKAAEEKQSEMNLLLNRYNHLRKHGEDKKEEEKAKEEPYYPGVNSMKRVKMSPPKPGSLYPTVDFESGSDRPESVMSTDSYDSCMTTTASEAPSLGKDIVTAARIGAGQLHDQELATIEEDHNDSMDTDDGDVMTDSIIGAEIDDMIDEAIDDEEDDNVPTPPKVAKTSTSSSGSDHIGRSESTTSWEFHTPQPVRQQHPGHQSKYQTPLVSVSSPQTPEQKVTIEGEEGPLMHTVSFYRKQKPQNTPVQRIVLNPSLETHAEVLESPRATITQKIHKLQEEASNQLPVIQQASSAVNLCRSTNEFFGSAEQVEGERLLLVATHKRQAAVNEIQRLKTEGGLGADPAKDNSVRGTVSLCGITLGLKKEFVQQVRSGEAGDFIHYFLCLVKCAGQCIPTQMVSSSEGLDGCQLHFPNLINFRDLEKDFTIQLEVFGLQTKKEQLTHDMKYHIKKGKIPSLEALTPKLKMSKTKSKLARPNVSSPGGPHTVRTSSFAMVW